MGATLSGQKLKEPKRVLIGRLPCHVQKRCVTLSALACPIGKRVNRSLHLLELMSVIRGGEGRMKGKAKCGCRVVSIWQMRRHVIGSANKVVCLEDKEIAKGR